MKKVAVRVAGVLLTVLLILYIGFQVYQHLYKPFSVDVVLSGSVQAEAEHDGFFIRQETPLQGKTGGVVYYALENGQRVGKNGAVAEIFSNEQQALDRAKIVSVQQELGSLEQLQSSGNTTYLQFDVLDKQLSASYIKMLTALSAGNVADSIQYEQNYVALQTKRQLASGAQIDLSARISDLNSQLQRLKSEITNASSVVKSPVAGYYVNFTDGYEGQLLYENAPSLNAEDVNKILSEKQENRSAGTFGKIVTQYDWYFAMNLDPSEAASLEAGKKVTLRFPHLSCGDVSATVVALNKGASEKTAVILKCDQVNSELVSARFQTAQLVLHSYDGLLVNSKAIRFVNGERGVYVLNGQTIEFKKVDYIYSQGDYVVSKNDSADQSIVGLYDEIVVEGKNLYDGKIVR